MTTHPNRRWNDHLEVPRASEWEGEPSTFDRWVMRLIIASAVGVAASLIHSLYSLIRVIAS